MLITQSTSTYKKILYIASGRSAKSTSPGRKINEILNTWRALGYLVEFVCGGDMPDSVKRAAGTEYEISSFYQKWYRKSKILEPAIYSAAEYRDIVNNKFTSKYLEPLQSAFCPDVIWERSSRLHNAGLIMAKKMGIPYVLEWKDHLIPYSFSLFRWYAKLVEQQKEREADFIVVESQVLLNKLREKGIDGKKIIVAHNAVDSEKFSFNLSSRKKIRNTLGVSNKTILVGYFGSYAFYHDALRLVMAAKNIRDRGEENIVFLMVGNGKDFPIVKKTAKAENLLGTMLHLHSPISVTEVPDWLSALDIAVLPGSTDIICPIKVLEYMACGLATIVPDYQCNREIITDQENGLLFKPESEQSLADSILCLAHDDALRTKVGLQARNDVLTSYGWMHTWGNALQEVIKRIQK